MLMGAVRVVVVAGLLGLAVYYVIRAMMEED